LRSTASSSPPPSPTFKVLIEAMLGMDICVIEWSLVWKSDLTWKMPHGNRDRVLMNRRSETKITKRFRVQTLARGGCSTFPMARKWKYYSGQGQVNMSLRTTDGERERKEGSLARDGRTAVLETFSRDKKFVDGGAGV
jgi:hypothetical protein